MPDWSYHPFFKPVFFRMAPEEARALTMRLLEIQATTAAGRRLFKWLSPKPPQPSDAVELFGLKFPSPVGLASGIDTEATALTLLQHLNFGFVQVGPVYLQGRPRRYATDPMRIRDAHALVRSPNEKALRADELALRVGQTVDLSRPVGFLLGGENPAEEIACTNSAAAFYTLRANGKERVESLRRLRGMTKKPLLLRLPHGLSDSEMDALTDAMVEAGIDGCVALRGMPCALLADGEMDGPGAFASTLRATEHIARRHGKNLPIMGSGGVITPADAVALFDAGAGLIELYAGFVFSGPGLPARIMKAKQASTVQAKLPINNGDSSSPALQHPNNAPRSAAGGGLENVIPTRPRLFPELGPYLVGFTGIVLIGSGIFALLLAATVKMLPYDVQFLGMTMEDLCSRNACRIVHFMAHDRVSFGGSIISVGAIYAWLGAVPLRRGEAWAWWTAFISGVLGFGSFLTYLGYGYLDVWHGRATLALLPVFVIGLILSFRDLKGVRGPRALTQLGAKAWVYSPAGIGRLAMTFTAFGMILGGLIIMGVGMTRVFVPQDLEYMGVTRAELQALNPRLIPLIAHDRAGFGGGLCSTGLAVMACVWLGIKPGAAALWRTLLIAGVVGFATAIGVHPVVGYTSFVHLAPAYAGALAFTVGMAWLYKPMCRSDSGSRQFPDI
ncbi:MAG: hypothetical protein IPK82_35630 [Polyangiaceae bacterium]|nr:hypothetical protein [Polyangiaceae bacterium]